MPKYLIKYYFDGEGEVEVKAKSKEEARDKFFEGDWQGEEKEWGDTYNIDEVQEL